MAKHAHLSDTSGNDGSRLSDAAGGYAVGYGRPPTHSRFKPGQCSNPRGRPKRQRNVRTVVEETLNQRITVREGDRTRSVTKLDGVILTMVAAAAKGNPKAQASLITLMRSLRMTDEAPEATSRESFTADDEAVIADYLRRRGSELPQSNRAEGNDAPAPAGTTLPVRETES